MEGPGGARKFTTLCQHLASRSQHTKRRPREYQRRSAALGALVTFVRDRVSTGHVGASGASLRDAQGVPLRYRHINMVKSRGNQDDLHNR
jgi:hypothetical protein